MRFNRSRRFCTLVLVVAMTIPVSLSAGCDTEESLQAFRDNAASSIGDGIKSILTGVVDGLFAATIPGADNALDESETTTE